MKEFLIADDHHVVRKGLMVICQQEFGLGQMDQAASCSEIMSALKKKRYTHVILDLVLRDGMALEIIPNIMRLYPDLNVLIFTIQPIGMYRAGLEHYGITNYLSKTATERETLRKLKDFVYGNSNNRVKVKSVDHLLPGGSFFDRFTPREKVVLHYLLQGLGSTEIGDVLGMKQNTISTFKKRILEKSDARNVLELKELIDIFIEVEQSQFK
ncbi:MAG: response regulator transcription factor [Puia sp.]|nr:response regulator transcription factor [Puia sp.]